MMDFKALERVDSGVAVNVLSRKALRELQTILKALGYYSGEIDAIAGEGTRKAIADFKKASYLEYPNLIGKTTVEVLFDAYDALGRRNDTAPSKAEGTVSVVGLEDKINLKNPIIAGGHFFWSEALHGGQRMPQTPRHTQNIIDLAKRLEDVRERLGNRPMTITSWYRPEPYNRRAGGARQSQHLGGGAVDVAMAGETGRSMGRRLSDWDGGLGIYRHIPNILHIDNRGYRARWGGAGT